MEKIRTPKRIRVIPATSPSHNEAILINLPTTIFNKLLLLLYSAPKAHLIPFTVPTMSNFFSFNTLTISASIS